MNNMRTVKKNAVSSKTTRGPATLTRPRSPRNRIASVPALPSASRRFDDRDFREASGMTNTRDMQWKATTYTDSSSTSIRGYWVDLFQTVFGTSDAPTKSNIVNRCRVSVLPNAQNAQVASTSYVVQAGVPASSVQHGEAPPRIRLVNATNTIVNPTFNIGWKTVLDADFSKIFRDSLNVPFMDSSSETNGSNLQELFRIKFVNPDDGSLYDVPVQIRIETWFTSILSVSNTILSKEVDHTAWTSAQLPITSEDDFAQINLLGLANNR